MPTAVEIVRDYLPLVLSPPMLAVFCKLHLCRVSNGSRPQPRVSRVVNGLINNNVMI